MKLAEITTDRLYAALNAARIELGLSWRGLAGEIGVSPSTLSRMPQRSPSMDGFLRIVGWLSTRGLGDGCTHDGAIMVGGIGTLLEPPNVRRVCLQCGREV